MAGDTLTAGNIDLAQQTLLDARAAMPRINKGNNGEAIQKTAEDFTAVFMAQMLQPMMEGLETDDVFGGGHGEDAMRGFLVQEYGKAMSTTQISKGITDAVVAEMLRLQQGG